MFKLYTDKKELFEAKLDIKGASIDESICRLVIESDNYNLMFNGTVDSNGNCEIPIKKLKRIYSEGDKGTIRLEVIAEDTYFIPWESDFVVETSKKVTVEVKKSTQKSVDVKVKSNDLQTAKNIVIAMKQSGINLDNLSERKTEFREIVSGILVENSNPTEVKKNVLRILKRLR